jgi:outer membrane autotransporter protein
MTGQIVPRRASFFLMAGLLALASVHGFFSGRAHAQSVTVTVSLNVTVSSSVDAAKVRSATRSAIRSFMSDRANLLTSNGPDTSRIHERLRGGSLFGGDEQTGAGLAPDGPTAMGGGSGVLQRYGEGAGAGLPYRGGVGTGAVIGGLVMNPLDRFAPGRGSMVTSVGQEGFAWDEGDRNVRAGRGSSALPFTFSGSSEDGTGRFQFATSLAKIREAATAAERDKRASLSPDGAARLGLRQGAGHGEARPAPFDVWLQGNSAYFETSHRDGRRKGHAAIVSAGADVLLRPGVLLGVMAQLDWMSDSSPEVGRNRDGQGWMAGPYLSLRLTPHLFFDARATWGRSDNKIDPLGSYVDSFETSRALASAKLTGYWSYDALKVRPSAEVLWYSETQDAYENAIGISIAKQSFSLGRAVIGPELGYKLEMAEDTIVEPFVGVKAIWDFARTQDETAAGEPIGNDGLTARAEAGLSVRTPSGISLRAAGAYDGIGSSRYHAVQGRARVAIPLQ